MPKRILLIEDRSLVVRGIQNTLNQKAPNSIIIDTAGNFSKAIKNLSDHEYDLISLDLNMPRITQASCFDELAGTTLNGWLFLKHYFFRDGATFKDKYANTKIIIFSGFINELKLHILNLPEGKKDIEEAWFKTVELVYKGCGEYNTIADKILSCLDISK